MTRIILERHGQSVGNAMRKYLGHSNLGLSELGREQAVLAAECLKDVHIDAIYSSDLERAYATALPHAQLRGLEVKTSSQLREFYIGEWEGADVDWLVKERYDEFVLKWLGEFGTFTFPGGESVLDGAERMYNALVAIARENDGGVVLVASHAAIIRAFYCKISGIEPEKMAEAFPFPTNASFTTVDYDGEKFIPVEFSHDDHINIDKNVKMQTKVGKIQAL
ncbi:MAG: histidine phosphatase family protein [Clostridia bacterium]|nr:histidine phosphatase family protein [Clostridia bacterium]